MTAHVMGDWVVVGIITSTPRPSILFIGGIKRELLRGWRRVRAVLAPNERVAVAISKAIRDDHDQVDECPDPEPEPTRPVLIALRSCL